MIFQNKNVYGQRKNATFVGHDELILQMNNNYLRHVPQLNMLLYFSNLNVTPLYLSTEFLEFLNLSLLFESFHFSVQKKIVTIAS